MHGADMKQLQSTADDETETVYWAMLQAIQARDLLPGTKLSEETIGASFGISRPVVRGALNRLSTDQLVVFERNRGAFVASPTEREADEIFALWAMIEAQMMRELAGRLTGAQLDELQANVDENRRHLREGNRRSDIEAAQQFHMLLARALDNRALEATIFRLICRSALVLALHPRRKRTEFGIDEHQQMIDHLRNGDGEAAAQAARAHLLNTLARARMLEEANPGDTLGDVLVRYAGIRPVRS